MKTMKLGNSDLTVPVMGLGLQHVNRIKEEKALREYFETCLELGLNFVDHADVYGIDDGHYGTCEELFRIGTDMNQTNREKWIIQDKVGFSDWQPDGSLTISNEKDYILEHVNASLKRLNTEYLDVLLIHAPDALVEPEGVAEAFDRLESEGKVRHFGVSNHNPLSCELLKKYVKQPLVANQLMFSLVNSGIVQNSMYINMAHDVSVDRDGGVLNYCRIHDMTIQCFCTMQYGYMSGSFMNSPLYPEVNAKLQEVAEKKGVSKSAIALAWILRHPAHMMPLTGTMNVAHLRDNATAVDVELSHDEWWDLWKSAGNFAR